MYATVSFLVSTTGGVHTHDEYTASQHLVALRQSSFALVESFGAPPTEGARDYTTPRCTHGRAHNCTLRAANYCSWLFGATLIPELLRPFESKENQYAASGAHLQHAHPTYAYANTLVPGPDLTLI